MKYLFLSAENLANKELMLYNMNVCVRDTQKVKQRKESSGLGFQSHVTYNVQRVLALCYFWDLEKVALAKNRISKIFILCTH